MSDKLTLQDIDVDGAIQETAAAAMDALQGDTRSQFLRRAGIAGGAFMGGGAVLGALAPAAFANPSGNTKFDRPPSSVFGKGDIGILNFALTLEYLESQFYLDAQANQRRKAFIPNNQPAAHVFLSAVVDDEVAHRDFLKKALGKDAIKKPNFNFHGADANYKDFLDASFAFENTGVHAYSGQGFNLSNAHYLADAVSILTIEARHAAAVGLIRNDSDYGITPSGAFDHGLGASEVLKAVDGLHFITKIYPAPTHT